MPICLDTTAKAKAALEALRTARRTDELPYMQRVLYNELARQVEAAAEADDLVRSHTDGVRAAEVQLARCESNLKELLTALGVS